MMQQQDYPGSIDEILDDTVKYRKSLIKIMNRFKSFDPWDGTPAEKAAKLYWLHIRLCKIYDKKIYLSWDPAIIMGVESKNGGGWYQHLDRHIHLYGKVSVLTFLHEWGHVLYGSSEYAACWWSINLFRKIFPKNFNKLRHRAQGHLLAA